MAMKNAGIDTTKYLPYSTQHASSSKALARGVPLDEVLRLGGWKNPSVFGHHYNLPILHNQLSATAPSEESVDLNTEMSDNRRIPKLANA